MRWVSFLAIAAVGAGQPPPGKLVDVGGHELHLNCSGSGRTVVLEAAFGGSSLDWVLVQPGVAKFARVCSYDRAGLGWSAPGPLPRDGKRVAAELRELLRRAEVAPPYLMVAHSMGGVWARIFAQEFPADVLGMVLVDASHEDQWDAPPRRYWGPPSIGEREKEPAVERAPAVQKLIDELTKRGAWNAAATAEGQGLKTAFEQLKNGRGAFPVVPLIVLSRREELGPGHTGSGEGWRWQEIQKRLAGLSPFGQWRPVPGSNHYIQLSRPEAVVGAIRELVDMTTDWRLEK